MSRMNRILAVGACAFIAAPAVAVAKPGDRSFEQTYPHASKLCAAVAQGKVPKKLEGSAAAVTAACATLNAGFTTAKATFDTASGPLREQRAAAVATMQAACEAARTPAPAAAPAPVGAPGQGPRQNHPRRTRAIGAPGQGGEACRTARENARTTVKDLRERSHGARQAYHDSVQAARKAFWTTIRGLRGGSTLTPDAPRAS